jgi:tRNA threonylcarbamoyladenosine biosynthesis protein TsaE
MLQLGAELAGEARPGFVLLLQGELGAGKTTLARGFLRALGYEGEVRSPTFNLLWLYETEPPVCHADLYRLERPEQVEDLGLHEYFDTHAVLVEWPERNLSAFPEDARLVKIEVLADGKRRVTLPGGAT